MAIDIAWNVGKAWTAAPKLWEALFIRKVVAVSTHRTYDEI